MAGSLVLLGLPVHLLAGVRRFYCQGWPVTAVKATTLTVAYVFVVAVTTIG